MPQTTTVRTTVRQKAVSRASAAPSSRLFDVGLLTPAPTPVTLQAKTQALLQDVRAPFLAFSEGFQLLTMSRTELAPRFMKAFTAFAADTSLPFIAFVRYLVPEVPVERAAYRAHAAYQAADYLRRLSAAVQKPKLPKDQRPASAYQALLKVLATLEQLDPQGKVWRAIWAELRWNEPQANRVRAAAERVGPVQVPKPRALRKAS